MKPNNTGCKRLIYATGYSLKGLYAAWKYESAIRQEFLALVILFPISFSLPVTKVEHILMIASLVLVVIVELLNSAVECVVDRVGNEYHELSGRAKDISSSAVFVSILLALFVWFYILF